MTVYTYWGNKDEKTNGTSVLEISSGWVKVGESADFTTQEYNYFIPEYDLRAGALTWTRTDFPWATEDKGLVHTFPTGEEWIPSPHGGIGGGTGGGSGAVAPGTPSGVSATAGDSSALVSWAAPSSGGSPILGYVVTPYIGGTPQTPISTGSTASNYNVTGLTNGTAYTFVVAAVNAIGTGSTSSHSNSVTPATGTAPGAPTGVSGTAGDAQVSLSWTAPASNGGSAITGYRITPYIGASAQTAINTGTTATSRTITGLTNGTAYTFKVAATNAIGTGSDSTASGSVTPTSSGLPTFVFASTDGNGVESWTVTSNNNGGSGTPQTIRVLRPATVLTATDNFNRANGGLGSNWTAGSYDPVTLAISSNKVAGGSGGSGANSDNSTTMRTAETYTNDHYSELQVSGALPNPSWVGVGVRMQTNGSIGYVAIYFNNSGTYEFDLYKRVAGTWTQIGSAVSIGASPLADGTKLRLTVIGSRVIFTQDTTTIFDVIDTAITGGGSPGIATYRAGTADSWQGGNATKVPHNFLYVMPQAAGEPDSLGDGVDVILAAGIQDSANVTVIAPAFNGLPWIADSLTDNTRKYETFMVSELVAWVTSNLAVSGSEKHWLIGYSKGGLSSLDLLFRHPTVFDAASVWDFPGTDMTVYTANSADNYSTQTNFDNNYRLSAANLATWASPFTGQYERIWMGGYNTFQTDLNDTDAALTTAAIPHIFGTMANVAHRYDSGWVPEAIRGLLQRNVITDDFNRADGGLGPNWTNYSVGSDVGLSISSNAVVSAGASALGGAYRNEQFSRDQWAEITMPSNIGSLPATDFVGLSLRNAAGGQNNYFGIYFNEGGTTHLSIYRRDAGAGTSLGSYNTTLASGDKLRFRAFENKLILSVNGVDRITVTDSTYVLGSPGLISFGAITLGDNFKAGGMGTSVAVPLSSPTITDNFNRSDGALGSNWANTTQDSAHIVVASNKAQGGTATALETARYVGSSLSGADYFAEVEVSGALGTGDFIGPAVRMSSDGANLYGLFYWNASGSYQIVIYKRVAGTYTQIGGTASIGSTPLPDGTKLRLAVSGSSLLAYSAGQVVVAANDSSITSADAPGIVGFGVATCDNWGAGLN